MTSCRRLKRWIFDVLESFLELAERLVVAWPQVQVLPACTLTYFRLLAEDLHLLVEMGLQVFACC